jgi:hypothetical protein
LGNSPIYLHETTGDGDIDALLALKLDVEPKDYTTWAKGQQVEWEFFNKTGIKEFNVFVNDNKNNAVYVTSDSQEKKDAAIARRTIDASAKVDAGGSYDEAYVHFNLPERYFIGAYYGAKKAAGGVWSTDQYKQITADVLKLAGQKLGIYDINEQKYNNLPHEVTGETVNVKVGPDEFNTFEAAFDGDIDHQNAYQWVKWEAVPTGIINITELTQEEGSIANRRVQISATSGTQSGTTVLTAKTRDNEIVAFVTVVLDANATDNALIGATAPSAIYANGALTLTNLAGSTATVTALTGQTVAKFAVTSDNSARTTTLAPGVYILNAVKAGKPYTTKFVVQ